MTSGCGTNVIGASIATKYPQIKVTGVDINEKRISNAAKTLEELPNIYAVPAMATALKVDKRPYHNCNGAANSDFMQRETKKFNNLMPVLHKIFNDYQKAVEIKDKYLRHLAQFDAHRPILKSLPYTPLSPRLLTKQDASMTIM